MKTNHRRGFKEKGNRRKGGTNFVRRSTFAGIAVDAPIVVHDYGGKKGQSRVAQQAKHFVRSRIRFHEKMSLRKVVSSLEL